MKITIATNGNLTTEIQVERIDYPAATLGASLTERLKLGIVLFAFKKVDGQTRKAFGTTDPAHLPVKPADTSGAPKKERTPNPDLITYFDMGAKDWRSFRAENILAIY